MKPLAIPAFLLGFVSTAFAQDTWKDVYSESAWADRDRWQKSAVIIQFLKLAPGSTVADIGCHEGYMTVKLANTVGASGIVYAVDIESGKLERLKKNLAERNITQVVPTRGDPDDPHLPEGSLDAVLIMDTYHEMDAHDQILLHVRRALKPGGRLILCEAIADSRRKSSREEQERRHELGLTFALEDAQKAGFTVIYKADPFVDRSTIKGDKMWILVLKK